MHSHQPVSHFLLQLRLKTPILLESELDGIREKSGLKNQTFRLEYTAGPGALEKVGPLLASTHVFPLCSPHRTQARSSVLYERSLSSTLLMCIFSLRSSVY